MNSGTLAPTRREQQRRQIPADAVAILIAAVVAATITLLAVRSPGHIEQFVVENSHEYSFDLSASSSPDEPRTPVGTARRDATVTLRKILDQGDAWTFHFSAQGREAGAFTLTREQLAEAAWSFAVPDEIAETLRALGVPPTPEPG